MSREADNCEASQGNAENGLKSKKRRSRTAFTEWQLAGLERRFSEQQYMVGEERTELAQSLQLNPLQVKIWFQNRRIRWRREHFERIRQVNAFTATNPGVNLINKVPSTSSHSASTSTWNTNRGTINIKKKEYTSTDIDKNYNEGKNIL